MVDALLLLAGIALVSGIVVLLDWLGRRKDRRVRQADTKGPLYY